MGDRGIGKPWTPYEDSLLTQAVSIHGEVDNWKNIALSVPGRTNKACRKRWLHSLSPSVKKTAWTFEEDQLLLSLYAIHSAKWSVIARHITGRTDDACSKRYREALDPSLKRDEWTHHEDALLIDSVSRLGLKWGQVGQELQRSGLACRNRWRMIERKKAALVREDASRSAAAQTSQQFYTSHAPPEWSSVPVQPSSYWDGNVSHYPPLEQFRPNPAFMSAQPAASASPPPFQFASSSLSAALTSSPAVHDARPSSTYTNSRRPEYSQGDSNAPAEPSGFDVERDTQSSYGSRDVPPIAALVDYEYSRETSHTGRSHNSPVPTATAGDFSDSGESERPATPPTVEHSPPPMRDEQPIYAPEAPVAPDPLRHYRPPARNVIKSARKAANHQTPRLSSTLPATSDPNVLAYACGHQRCWPSDVASSRCCFATSRELLDHTRTEHPDALCVGGPFRCGLQGCGKSWKSINGLQYHLQIAKAHFQQALCASRTEDDSPPRDRKLHPCPYPDCHKQYKQLSGLRYHMSHGHLGELPVQLEVIPPSLARRVAERTEVPV